MDVREGTTSTSAFGVGRREGHDATAFYSRFAPPELSDDETVDRPDELIAELGSGRLYTGSIAELQNLPANSVALVVTSPPYFAGKEYELAVSDDSGVPATYVEFLDMLRTVFAECVRVLEPGGRVAVNVANLGRKPYRSLSADVISILQDDLGLLLRGEIVWEKASSASGSCAWGSFGRASNPVLRDLTERVIVASKGRFARALTVAQRRDRGLPHDSTLPNDEFVDATKDVWRIDSESATRVGHPAPFPIDLPRRLIDLYTYVGDIVLDPFVGSGTTLVATARTGRIGVGYDTDPAYIELSEQRLQDELEADPPRQESYVGAAVSEAKKVSAVAARVLAEAGFVDVAADPKHPSRVATFDFAVSSADGGRRWLVDVGGLFTTGRLGLERTDAVWNLLGRLAVHQATDEPLPVLVLTPCLPRPGSPGDKALRAVGPAGVFDAIELYDHDGIERLASYAEAGGSQPLAGFWTPAELDAASRLAWPHW